METVKTTDGLEIGQDIDFQKTEWLIQRIGWGVMSLIILAALAGLFGPGPLSWTRAGIETGPFTIEYNRFTRYKAPSELHFLIRPEAASGETLALMIDREYLDKLQIEGIVPNPDSVEGGLDWIVYRFKPAESGQPLLIRFAVTASSIGLVKGEAGLQGGETISFNQIVYP